eukprot:scaffold17426_cov58-Attheya_sp.AAC.6
MVRLHNPTPMLHWWFFFLKQLYFPSTPRSDSNPSRSAPISRKVRRNFLNKNKVFLPCFEARFLILSVYRVQGCWAGMLGHKHIDSGDEDIAILASMTSYDVQIAWSVPKLFALTRYKRPPDHGILTGLIIGALIGCYYGAYLLSGYARLYRHWWSLASAPIDPYVARETIITDGSELGNIPESKLRAFKRSIVSWLEYMCFWTKPDISSKTKSIRTLKSKSITLMHRPSCSVFMVQRSEWLTGARKMQADIQNSGIPPFKIANIYSSQIQDVNETHFDTDGDMVICDNSANAHICNNKKMFVGESIPLTNGGVATIGSEDVYPKGIGFVDWTWKDDAGQKHKTRLKGVLYFPDSPVNILSITALATQMDDPEGTYITTKRDYSVFHWGFNQYERRIEHDASKLPGLEVNKGFHLWSNYSKAISKHCSSSKTAA